MTITNYALSFADESDAIEVVLIIVPENLRNKFIYNDDAEGVELVTYPNIYFKTLSPEIKTMPQLAKLVAEAVSDNGYIVNAEDMTASIIANTPNDYLLQMRELSEGYESLVTKIATSDMDNNDPLYEELNTFISNFYKKIDLVENNL